MYNSSLLLCLICCNCCKPPQAPEPGPAELAVTKVGPSQATIASPITFTVTAGVAPGSRPASPLVLVEELSDNKAAFDLPLPDAGERCGVMQLAAVLASVMLLASASQQQQGCLRPAPA